MVEEAVMMPREGEALLRVPGRTDLGSPDPPDEVEEAEAAVAVRLTTTAMTMTMVVTLRKDII